MSLTYAVIRVNDQAKTVVATVYSNEPWKVQSKTFCQIKAGRPHGVKNALKAAEEFVAQYTEGGYVKL